MIRCEHCGAVQVVNVHIAKIIVQSDEPDAFVQGLVQRAQAEAARAHLQLVPNVRGDDFEALGVTSNTREHENLLTKSLPNRQSWVPVMRQSLAARESAF
jgi:hypothetical protein